MGVGSESVLISLAIEQKKLTLYTTLYSGAIFYKKRKLYNIKFNYKDKIFYKKLI